MQAPVLFETDRLIHRISDKHEFDTLYALMADPAVRHYLGHKEPGKVDPISSVKIGQRLRSDVDEFARHGAAHGMIVFKPTMQVIGYGGVGRYDPAQPDSLELGYQFTPPCWGLGLGSEFVKAALAYGFDRLNARLIHACTMPENTASNRIMAKAGMVFVGYYAETNRNLYQLERAV